MVSDYKINRELEQNEFFYEDAMQNHEESDSYNENGVRVRFNIKGAFDPSKVKTVDQFRLKKSSDYANSTRRKNLEYVQCYWLIWTYFCSVDNVDVESKDNLPTDLNILRISGLVDVTDGLIVLTKAGIQEIAAILSAVPENLVIPIPPVLELSDAVKPNIGILGVSFNSEFGKITREGMDGDVYLGKKECALFEVIYNSGETGVARHILQARCTGNVAGLIDAINKKIGKFSIMLGKNARSGPTVLKLKG